MSKNYCQKGDSPKLDNSSELQVAIHGNIFIALLATIWRQGGSVSVRVNAIMVTTVQIAVDIESRLRYQRNLNLSVDALADPQSAVSNFSNNINIWTCLNTEDQLKLLAAVPQLFCYQSNDMLIAAQELNTQPERNHAFV
jgi:hypothetical protein